MRLTCTELEGRQLGCALDPMSKPAHCEPWPHNAARAPGTGAAVGPWGLARSPQGVWRTAKLTDPRRRRDMSGPICTLPVCLRLYSLDRFEIFIRSQRIVLFFLNFVEEAHSAAAVGVPASCDELGQESP